VGLGRLDVDDQCGGVEILGALETGQSANCTGELKGEWMCRLEVFITCVGRLFSGFYVLYSDWCVEEWVGSDSESDGFIRGGDAMIQ